MTSGTLYSVRAWRNADVGMTSVHPESSLAVQWEITGPGVANSGMGSFCDLNDAASVAYMLNRAFQLGKEQKLSEFRNFIGVKS